MMKRVFWVVVSMLCLLLPTMALGDEASFVPYGAFTLENAYLRESVQEGADTVCVMPPNTPCLVIGTKMHYSLIEYDQVRGYVPTTLLTRIRPDSELERPTTVFLHYASIVYEKPLQGAATDTMLPRLTILDVYAQNGSYYVATVNNEKVYVPMNNCTAFSAERETSEFVQTNTAAHLYVAPDPLFFTEVSVGADHLLKVIGRCGMFYKLENDKGYLRIRDADVVNVRNIDLVTGFWTTDQRLQYSPTSSVEPSDVTLYARTAVEITQRTVKYYLVHYQDEWGYLPMEGFVPLGGDGMVENRIAAVTSADTTLELAQGTTRTGETRALPTGTQLWSLAKMEKGTLCALLDGTLGFAPQEALSELSKDSPITARDVYTAEDKPAYRFPVIGGESVTIPIDTLLNQVGTNGELYLVEYGGERLYITKNNLYQDDNAETLPGHTLRYYLLLEKLDHKLTVFLADENGNRTSTVVKTIITAVGKPSTPTPSGIFKLGGKQRWHRWGSGSYSPFAIEFVANRYIHGPLYWGKKESGLRKLSLEDIGHDRTSGCLRMAYDDAMWIYYHCASEETTLEIVKREAEQ